MADPMNMDTIRNEDADGANAFMAYRTGASEDNSVATSPQYVHVYASLDSTRNLCFFQ